MYRPPLPSGKIGEGAPSPTFSEGRGVCTQVMRKLSKVSVNLTSKVFSAQQIRKGNAGKENLS